MTSIVQTRPHGGHSHSHSHHHDNTYLTSSNKKDAGVRITRIGLYVNLVMAIGKGIGGYYFNSQALVADAFHALTDLVSDLMTLGTVSWSLEPPSTRFPRGYGKIESLGSLGVSGLLLTGGVLMGLNACEILYHELFADVAAHGHSHGILFGHSHSHNPADLGPNINAAWLAAGSIIVKEYLYRATMKIALERKSSILASNAVHHRIDSLTSIVALVAIGGSHVFTGNTWLDPVGGLIVSMMVIRAGCANTYAALLELADVGVDDDIVNSVRQATTKALDKVNLDAHKKDGDLARVRDVQGVKAGQNFLMDVELVVPGDWTIQEARRIEDLVREKIGSNVRGVRRVKVRFVPDTNEEPKFADEFIATDVNPESKPEKEAKHDDGHDHHDHSSNGDTKKRR
ncbi:hypothetical protein MMC07_002388 [Pseudocyphellaria aurata]|nr:hypothetical protein [Pseudocyphellaria aurata]